jgi:hypothetical protein
VTGNWVVNALVGWNNWPGEVGPKLDEINDKRNQDFGSTLKKAAGDDVSYLYPRYLESLMDKETGG